MLIKDEYTIECLKPYFPADYQPQLVVPCELSSEQLVALAAQASDEDADGIANCLKIGVEHSADSDANLALELAATIIQIGKIRENGSLVGLGTMAEGDTLAHSGRIIEAWERLEQAGQIYRDSGDEIGWARTRIGRLSFSSELSRDAAEEAFNGAREAEDIFLKAARYDRLLRLYHGWSIAHLLMGQYEQAIAFIEKGVELVKRQDDTHGSDIPIAVMYSDIGNAYNNLGEFQTAMTYLTRARQVLLAAQHHTAAAMAEYAMANNHMVRGHYRSALHLLLNSVIPNLSKQRADSARLTVADCYLALNRNAEAYEIARAIFESIRTDPNRTYQTGISALFLATAQSRLGHWSDARQSLDVAGANFSAYESMRVLIHLREGQIALRQGDCVSARIAAEKTAAQFKQWQQSMNWIDATLLEAEAALMENDLQAAQHLSYQALKYARLHELPPACYQSYVVLGQVLERLGRRHSSIRMYQAALTVLRHIKRSLTISLRGGFLEDKLLPFHRLMNLYFAGNQINEAFYTLEQLKSQVFLDYLTQRELLQWPETEHTRPLLSELSRLRDKYRWLSRLQAAPPMEEVEANPWYQEVASYTSLQQALTECEKNIRAVVEQLYLFSDVEPFFSAPPPELDAVQQHIDEQTMLLEFYADREQVWCLGITKEHAIAYPLEGSSVEIERLVDKWRSNLDFALEMNPDDPRSFILTAKARTIGERLYRLLVEPAAKQMVGKSHLVIVPYGFLHQMPFNMLWSDKHYLIETHEIVVLPSASLLLRPQVQRQAGTVVAAHSWDGSLQHSLTEGRMVHELMGGELFLEQAAQRDLLHRVPQQILHISTHGEHRLDQPDFAFIELGDGPVYTDDLLQCDLSYELVVLSACEVGRPHVTAGDELIGPGWSFLYAGAGSLITSLWRVNELHTFHLMESFYQALNRGETKAAALRTAQRELLAQTPDIHPAFWAAFQLIGHTGSLTVQPEIAS